jgi:hypothetical protein
MKHTYVEAFISRNTMTVVSPKLATTPVSNFLGCRDKLRLLHPSSGFVKLAHKSRSRSPPIKTVLCVMQ